MTDAVQVTIFEQAHISTNHESIESFQGRVNEFIQSLAKENRAVMSLVANLQSPVRIMVMHAPMRQSAGLAMPAGMPIPLR